MSGPLILITMGIYFFVAGEQLAKGNMAGFITWGRGQHRPVDAVQMSDIVTRLRQTRANMIGTEDEQHYWDCHDAADAIERLRLTDAERETVERVAATLEGWKLQPRDAGDAATLRGLLERLK